MSSFPYWPSVFLAAVAGFNVHVGNYGAAAFLSLLTIVLMTSVLLRAIRDAGKKQGS